MKYFLLIAFICFNFQFLIAQEDGPYKEYYDSGELKVEGQYKNKKRIGDWKSYHENGQISGLYSYNNGKRNEEQSYYYEDGTLKSKTEKVGENYITKGYYKSGNLEYEHQLKTGYYKRFLENGALSIEANYVDYQLVGDWKSYYENGTVKWLVTYNDGYREGAYKKFYDNGDIELEGYLSKDKVNGEEKRYLPNNILLWKGHYENNVLVNAWIKYSPKGKKLKKVKFKEGVAVKNEFKGLLQPTKVPDGVIEKVPVYPGCESVLTNRKRKACMTRYVIKHVSSKFNTEIAKTIIGLKGKQKILVNFKIGKTGEVKEVKATAAHPILKAEAIRVIELLPKFIPGYQRGKPVVVPFSLPIVFQVE